MVNSKAFGDEARRGAHSGEGAAPPNSRESYKSRLGRGSVAEERAVIARKGAALRSYGLTWKDVGTRLGVSAQHARKCFLEAGRKEDA
jgi:hypothetical protein